MAKGTGRNMRKVFKSRVVQFIAVLAVLGLASVVLFAATGWPGYVLVSIVLVLLAVLYAAYRLILLEWSQATTSRSTKDRLLDVQSQSAVAQKSLENVVKALQDGKTAAPGAAGVDGATASTAPVVSRDGTPVVGRMAADVAPALERQARLNQMLGAAAPSSSPGEGRRLIGIATPVLRELMRSQRSLECLSPSTARDQLEKTSAGTLIIDQLAFASGPWFGTESAGGSALFAELQAALAVARRRGILVCYIASGAVPDCYTGELAGSADVVVGPEADDPAWTEDIHLGMLSELIDYSRGGIR
ncbi:hypothetical protein ACQCSX_07450 [Pseudarthrobacter sp. P1]|uniref:hypothetical protein n=1 Tax=Pseudarthrobacter sp. P1 TaxID=3418418 RepID=UPI003CE8D333